MFIGLNPSTANENTDDPTIRRVIKFAKNWGYGGVYMLNLFTYVTAYPKELMKCDKPRFLADSYLDSYASRSKKIIFAWGNFKEAEKRGQDIIKTFGGGEVLGLNKNGSPKHPLYIAGKTVPIPYKSAWHNSETVYGRPKITLFP
jgi:hypothetical protein